ncbi:MAG: hypothetical protein FWF59_12785 [Turicibacter sp.]|nr:hypothetical protein [Turicibacter sp.]
MKPKKVIYYSEVGFFQKLGRFLWLKAKDFRLALKDKNTDFKEFGLTLYCGRQGGGKTTAMTEYLERMRRKYPGCVVLTNYGYANQDREFQDWNDFFEVRNGQKGVIFAIDEIQNEFNSTAWRNFPETLLSEITQQRKQRVKIIATSQVFGRVAKPLREQCYEVVECRTFLGRWTFTRAFDAYEYNHIVDNPEKKSKLRRLWRKSFVQDAGLRALYDSYAKIERIQRQTFVERSERV